jgi:hypothetical protein
LAQTPDLPRNTLWYRAAVDPAERQSDWVCGQTGQFVLGLAMAKPTPRFLAPSSAEMNGD